MNLEMDANEDFETKEVPTVEIVKADEAKKQDVEKVAPLRQVPMATTGKGLLVGNSLEEEFRLARAYCASGLMPKALNSPEKILVALQLCRELNLPPVTSIGKVMVVGGSPALFGDLPLGIVRRSGLLQYIRESFTYDDKGEVLSAVCSAKRKDTGEEVSRDFSVADAKRAGLFRNDIWAKYTKRMLQCRSRAWVLKDLFADVLGGLVIGEWEYNATIENGDVVGEARTQTAADELNEKFLETKSGTA